jgi:predicted amidohydrolase YtcJ
VGQLEATLAAHNETVLFHNARVHTVEDKRPAATWFTVRGRRFQRVGEGPPPPARKQVDLGGRVVVPGFVDAHTHFFQTGIDAMHVDLAGVADLAELGDRLHEESRPGGRAWVFANGFEEESLADAARLTRAELDDVHPRRPVWVNRVDYHSAVVNSAALRRLRIPLGTQGLVLGDDGRPTGILRGEAYFHAKQLVTRSYPVSARDKAIRAAVSMMVPRGITAVHALEGGPLFGDEGVQAVLRHMDRLPIDVTLFLQEKNPVFAERLGFRHMGGCILIDGSIGSYTAAVDAPYPGEGNERGRLYETARSLRGFVQSVHARDGQLAFHAIGARAIEVVLDTYAAVLDRSPRYDHRHRIEHFELATDAQIERAVDLGVVVSMQPTFELLWGGPTGMYANRLGDGWRRTNRLRDILDAGLRIAGGSDANVTPPDPILAMHAAVNLPNEAQRITPAEALRMTTLDAAYAGFNEGRQGSITPGKDASFVVLDRDPLATDTARIADTTVLQTWCRGRCRFRRNEDSGLTPAESIEMTLDALREQAPVDTEESLFPDEPDEPDTPD